jgi:photosystem II stability/assembly factor-like uncharacterized protein
MSFRRLLPSLLLLLVTIPGARAAVDPSLFQDLQWRLIGPFRGGRVLAVSGVPSEPEHFYFGSVNGGVWETRDAGRTWQPIFDSQPAGSIGALDVAKSDPRVIYAGSGEADMRSDIAQGNGMYKSADAGKSWTHIGLTDSQQIGRVIIHPADPNVVYVAALGHPYGPNAERGVFRTRNGGATWQRILSRNDSDTGAIDLAFEPGNPNVLYAALWQTRRTPWSVYPPSNGPGSGLFKSTDGGDSWTEVRGHGFPDGPGRIGLAVAPSNPRRVYAMVDAKEGGLYRSDDAGANWTRTSGDTRIWGRGWYFAGITVEPNDADVVYSCNTNVYRSADGGKTFAPVKGAPGGDDYHQLWIDPTHPERRILGVDQGAVLSLNAGRTWSSWYNQPTGQFYHVVTDNRFPYWVYGSQQDSGAAGVPSRTSSIDGISLTNFREITAGGESDNVAPDPENPDILYGGRVEKLDTRTQQTRSIDPTIRYPENDRRTWTLPLVFSPRNPKALYFANQRIYRTDDGGDHWTVISPDLTRVDPGTPANLDAVTAALHQQTGPRRGVVYTIAPSRTADGELWAGTDDGLIWRTRDEGKNWTNVTPAALTAWSKIGVIEASHFDGDSAYAAVDRHRIEDRKPYIYRTHDGGKTWQLRVAGIADGDFVNAVREDPLRKGLLYAATERGMYVSFDDGEQWQRLQQNLPVTSVRDIEIHGNDVVIATHGRAFWVLDDVSSLRQAPLMTGDAALQLYAPSIAVRERPAGFTGTPMPKDEPMASNPPFGATIDYVVGAPLTQPLTLEIYDSRNVLVRRYSSSDRHPAVDPARLRTSPEWVAAPSTLSTERGMHRFVWPLRHALPARLAGGWSTEGVWAPPGRYTIVLASGETRATQPLEVVADPRVALPPSAYSEQFELASRTMESWSALRAVIADADRVIAALTDRRAHATGALTTALEHAANSANMLLDGPPASAAAYMPPAPMTTLHYAESALEKVYGAVDGADAAPSPDAREGYAQAKSAADRLTAAWSALKVAELRDVNAQLSAAGLAPIALDAP